MGEDTAQDKTVIMHCTDLSRALKAQFISFREGVADDKGAVSSVSIDSRTLLPGALFVALIGAVQDGHRYIQAAFEAGAAAAMIARSRWEDPQSELAEIARKFYGILLVVEDTLKGLQEAAAYYLDRFPRLLKIGITGSSGKTTTKEILGAMIRHEKTVVMNQGNFNSETGLPLSVFMVRSSHEVGIFELGMNRHGEIEEITGVLKPHIALITNIGSAHIGFFGSKQVIAEEKKAIFSKFSGNECALIPADDPYRDFLAAGVRGRVMLYGLSMMEALGEVRDRGIGGFELVWDGVPVRCGLPGAHNLQNILAAAAIAGAVPISSRAIRAGLEAVKGLFGRTEILRGPVTVIQDCYNANPESMTAAIGMCDDLDEVGRRIYVIGSMLELGDRSQEAHRMIGRRLASSKADLVCLYGEETKAALEALQSLEGRDHKAPFFHTTRMDELSAFLSGFIRSGDVVLLKGSRTCALERLTEGLMAAAGSETPAAKGVC